MALREATLLRRGAYWQQAIRELPLAISPSRLVLAVIVAAFVLAMVWVQQTQSLVRIGGEVQRLEAALEEHLQRRQDLLAQLALLNDLPTVQRIAFTSLGMRAPERPIYTHASSLAPGISFDRPLWAAASEPLQETPWWEAFLRAISAKITSLRE